MATVFVNYRSDDASGTAVLMKRELSRAFGENSIFLATEMIPPGNDFESELLRRVRGCEVLMVLVGPRWLTARHPAGDRAIDHEEDWVRREIAEAFACGVRVVPVLVNDTERLTGAVLPDCIERLTRCQYLRLHHENFKYDIARIVDELAKHVPTLIPKDDPRTIHPRTPGESGAITVEDAVRDHGALLANVLRDGFTGRDWVIEEIDAFLRTHPCGYVWIEGEAGVGKTTLAAHLVRARGWIGHFARVPRGGSAQVGLQNLAGRLAQRYDLAEAGMLPERAFTPDGFDTLLAKAAARERRPLVLVVDGADESDLLPDTQPWGLPNLLPDGVYVVGTYRTGSPPPRCDSPRAVVRLAPNDPRNRADVAAHLRSKLSRPQADALAEGCGGVWIYLRYILDEIQHGVRHDLAGLPADLPAFYAASLDTWRTASHWEDGLLPVLATLAVAGEPLPTHTLAALAATDEPSVRHWCHAALRPFLSAMSTSPRTFEIYHASLREFLTGTTPRPGAPDREWLWAETLRSAATAAHHRIADHYLHRLDRLGDPVPGYPLRHLARHLVSAGRVADLHRLLGMAHTAGQDRIVNTWFAAHDAADTVDNYLDDVTIALRDAERHTDEAVAAARPAVTLADELRYHLIAASITSRTMSIPLDLLAALLSEGVWTPRRAIAYALRQPTPAARAPALTALVPHLPPGERAAALEYALLAASAVAADYFRVDALIRVAVHLPADKRPGVLAEALTAAVAVDEEHHRAERLRELAPHLPDCLLGEALASAGTIASAGARAEALTAIALHLPAGQRPAVFARALTAASMISSERQRAQAVAGLAPYVPAQAVAVASKITSDQDRAEALCAIAAHLPLPRRSEVLRDALAAAKAVPLGLAQVETLARLAPQLDPDERAAVLRDAVAAADAIASESVRGQALARVIPQLTADRRGAVVAWVSRIGGEQQRAELLAALLPNVPESQTDSVLRQALAAVRAVPAGPTRAEVLVELVRHAPSVADEALAAALAVHSEQSRAELLTTLAPHLPLRQRRTALTEALAAALTISSDYAHIATLVNAPDPPPEPATDAATTKHDRADIGREFGDWLTEALAFATSSTNAHVSRPTGARPVDTVRDALAVPDLHTRVRRLARLAPFLSPRQRTDVMAQQLSELAGTPDDDARMKSLAAIAPHLPADHIGRALALAERSTVDVSRALAQLIPTLTTARQLADALAMIGSNDRALLCALLTRAGEVLAPGLDYVALLRRTLWSVGRDTCLALLAIAVPRLREIAAADIDFDARTWAALRDVHRWWP